jgi:predicted small lipoprotein YifL
MGRYLLVSLAAIIVVTVVTGCNKKAPTASNPLPPSTAQASPETNAPPSLPKLDTAVQLETLPVGTESANKAMASHHLKEAVLALLKDDPKGMSSTQLERRRTAMQAAQKMVADGFAAGDPDAQEAATILRAYSSHAR